MAVAQPARLLDEITDFLASSPMPQDIVDYKLSDDLQRRALDLLTLNRENRLTPEDRLEMEEFMRMDHFLTMLKAKARLKLAGKE